MNKSILLLSLISILPALAGHPDAKPLNTQKKIAGVITHSIIFKQEQPQLTQAATLQQDGDRTFSTGRTTKRRLFGRNDNNEGNDYFHGIRPLPKPQ